MTDGAQQWFAIFSASVGDLVSVADVVTFPLNDGLRAVTVDGPQNGRYWSKKRLDWSTTEDPIDKVICDPTCDCRTEVQADPFPYAEEWFPADLVFTNYIGAAAQITFPSGKFTVPPLIDGIEQNVPTSPRSTSYLQFTTGNLTKDGVTVWAKAGVALNYTIPIVVHAVQRYKEKA